MTDSSAPSDDPAPEIDLPEPDAGGEILDPQDQPAAGGSADGEPAQGEGAPDSY